MASFAAEDAEAPLTAPWVEVHSENFLCAGGPRLAMLDAVAARYPVSCHGVGLSLGSAEGLDGDHLARLKHLFDRVRPALISEHLSWSVTEGVYLNDLLPLPYTAAALDVVCRNVDRAQQTFGRKILVENPSAYLTFASSTLSETEFLGRLVARTGCGLVLDINNVYVSAANTGFAVESYLAEIPAAAVGEIHLAGHTASGDGDARVLIDTHGAQVCDPVWALYAATIRRIGARPTLIEWDLDIPALPVLLRESARAQKILDAATPRHAHVA
jgi:uncharacterized protein (UPF0276 family)